MNFQGKCRHLNGWSGLINVVFETAPKYYYIEVSGFCNTTELCDTEEYYTPVVIFIYGFLVEYTSCITMIIVNIKRDDKDY